MPTWNEGKLLYMPISLPSMSLTKAAELIQVQDRIFKSPFPEVESIFEPGGHLANYRSGNRAAAVSDARCECGELAKVHVSTRVRVTL